MRMLHIPLLGLAIVGFAHSTYAQDTATPARQAVESPHLSSSSFGVQAGLSRDLYRAGFQYLPGYPDCSPLLRSGSGLAKSFGFYYAYRPSGILGNRLSLSLGAGYAFESGSLAADEGTSINLDGVATPATIHHELDVTLNRWTVSPGIRYEIVPAFSLGVGAEFGMLSTPTFSVAERLTNPADRGVFENGRRTRDEYSGSLPMAASVQSALTFGAQYELSMNALRTLELVPSLRYKVGLSNLVQGLPWKENGLGASLAVQYTPLVRPEVPAPPVPKRDTVIPKIPVLLASITASGLDSDGAEEPVAKLRVEELYEVSEVPLIPYVFFGNGVSRLDTRYLTRPEHASERLESKPGVGRIALYGDVLNIIGERLEQHPAATLTVTGCMDAQEHTQNPTLAADRAAEVKRYLTASWNIPSSRILIRARMLPGHPSPVGDTDGTAENRRVEIASNDALILEPVVVGDTLRTATPPTIRFHPALTAEASIRSWTLNATQNGRELISFNGKDSVPPQIDWVVANDQSSVPKAPGELEYKLRVTDKVGQSRTATGELPVEQYTLRTKRREFAQAPGNARAEIERFTLVLFDFNSSELSSENLAVLHEIKKRIATTSIVRIEGFTDRIGDPIANRTLALQRAQNTAKALGVPMSSVVTARGGNPLYDNTRPEGRFYSRTVEITIQSPMLRQE